MPAKSHQCQSRTTSKPNWVRIWHNRPEFTAKYDIAVCTNHKT